MVGEGAAAVPGLCCARVVVAIVVFVRACAGCCCACAGCCRACDGCCGTCTGHCCGHLVIVVVVLVVVVVVVVVVHHAGSLSLSFVVVAWVCW